MLASSRTGGNPVGALDRRHGVASAALLLIAGASACAEPDPVAPTRTIDGPTSIAFSCYGSMSLTGGDEVVSSAMPVSACAAWARGETPAGQEAVSASDVSLYGFVLQQQHGTLAVVEASLIEDEDLPYLALRDADAFSPGRNAIPMGTQPVDVVTDPSGCHVMTINGGTCDLSILDVDAALAFNQVPRVQRVDIVNAAGERIGAKPRAVVAQPSDSSTPVGVSCPAAPDSLVYVAYPDCNMVAAVHAATGEVRAGIVFRADGTVELTDGDVGCSATDMNATCGGVIAPPDTGDAGMIPDAGVDAGIDAGVDAGTATGAVVAAASGEPVALAVGGTPRPVALHVDEATGRLYIGTENSAEIVVVELDEAFLPASSWSVPLEGDVGVTALTSSPLINMGGYGGLFGGGGERRFVYAAATDATVRVADVTDLRRECDTQLDPRFVHDVRDVGLLSCLPVGDPALPRRAGARSPGIHLPGNALPLDIAFVTIPPPAEGDNEPPPVDPSTMIGSFALISMSTGGTLVVTVDDDNYRDFEVPDGADPLQVDMALALAHQVRDAVTGRSGSLYCASDEDGQARICDYESPVASCAPPSNASGNLGPRATSTAAQIIDTTQVAPENRTMLPNLRQLACEEDGASAPVPVSELSYMAPDYLREYVYPDLQEVENEVWSFTWEGRISQASLNDDVADLQVRFGAVSPDGDTLTLRDGAQPFCKMGAAPFDVVTLAGCDPARGDGQCKAGETCYVHPDAPATVTSGMCLPADRVDALADTCRDVLSSRRRFTVKETYAGRLVLGERRRVLRTTPAAGCIDAAQCQTLFEAEQALASADATVDLCTADDGAADPARTWACEADPTHAPGPDRCVMTCTADSDCEEGSLCSGGYCVEGGMPPAECLGTLQRYDVRVGEAFAVVGSRTGFLHNRIVDPNTGLCIDDPTGHPLDVGRLPLTADSCDAGDITGPVDALAGLTVLEPNPCTVVVRHTEQLADGSVETRDARALRFRNRALTTHVVDPVLQASCEGGDVEAAAVFPGYTLSIQVTGGFAPMQVAQGASTQLGLFNVRYPVSITSGPLGDIWIMDQGDSPGFGVRGQVLRMLPEDPASRTAPPAIQ